MTTMVTIGGKPLRIETVQRDGRWVAMAVSESGDARGPTLAAETEREAIARATKWLEWHDEHATAIEALREAEQAYQRVIAGSPFLPPGEGPSPAEVQKEALDRLEESRRHLDEVRQQKPEG
jgi:hypothetical protein